MQLGCETAGPPRHFTPGDIDIAPTKPYTKSGWLTMIEAGSPSSHVLVHAALGGVLLVHLAAASAPERRNLLAVKVEGGQASVALPAHCHMVPVIIHPAFRHSLLGHDYLGTEHETLSRWRSMAVHIYLAALWPAM